MFIFGIDKVVAPGKESMEHLSTLSQVVFKGDRIYRHHLFRVNYTTYDVHRAQDTINPRTDHCDIMLLAPLDSAHPFLYACILGIFHANVIYSSPGSKDLSRLVLPDRELTKGGSAITLGCQQRARAMKLQYIAWWWRSRERKPTGFRNGFRRCLASISTSRRGSE